MPGESINPTPHPPLDLQEQINNPALQENVTRFEDLVKELKFTMGSSVEFAEAFQSFESKMDTIVTPGGEEIADPNLIALSHEITGFLLKSIKVPLEDGEADILSLPSVIDKTTTEEKRKLLATFPPSVLSRITADRGAFEDGERESAQRFTRSRNWRATMRTIDVALALSREDISALSASDALDLLKPIDVANTYIHAHKSVHEKYDPDSPQLHDRISQFMHDAPSVASVEHLGLQAYVATIRTLRACKDDPNVGFYTPSARETLRLKYGFSEESIFAHEAARILELAKRPLVPGDEDLNGVYELPIFKIFNLTPPIDRLAPSVPFGVFSDAAWIPAEKQPAIAAQEVMYELICKVFPTEPWGNMKNATERLRHEGLARIVRPAIMRNTQEFIERVQALHKELIDAAFEVPMDHEDLKFTLVTEEYMVNRLAELSASLSQTVIAEVAPEATKLTLNPIIREYVNEVKEAVQLMKIEAFCDEVRPEIAKLDEPYAYTSKRIRSYENGPVTLSSLKQALDKRNTLPDEDSRRTLAMLILQSEHAADPAAYFEELRDTRDMIELYMGEMTYLGQDGQANVTDVLRWVDEMIDAGMENSVNHARLKQFIQNYYLGVEEELSPVPEVEPPTEVEPEATTQEEEPTTETTESAEPRQNTENDPEKAMAEYLSYFAEVLQDVDVEFSDVAFFSKASVGTGREVSEGLKRPRGERFVDIDKNRLEGLVKLKADFEHEGKSARLIFTKPTKSQRIPYIALYVQERRDDSTGVCFMENVKNGTATYCFGVDGTLIQDWDELWDYTLEEWRSDWDATPLVHPAKGSAHFMRHYTFDLKQYALTKLAQVNKDL